MGTVGQAKDMAHVWFEYDTGVVFWLSRLAVH